MRYIADSSGKVLEVSFGAMIECNGKSCTEYIGGVPEGYGSLADWFIQEADKLYRWKIVNSELTQIPDAAEPATAATSTITVTTAGTDLDDYMTEGTWYFSTSHTPHNIPAGNNGWLRVMRREHTDNIIVVKQVWYRQGKLNEADHEIYVRSYSSSGTGWSNWVRLLTEKDSVGGTGYTPQKGIDYFTDADKKELTDSIKEDLAAKAPANVLDFGAKGDGVTDDTAAFKAAIATGRDVYVPPGKRYLITHTLKIEKVYQTVFGEIGRGGPTSGSCIYFKPSATPEEGVDVVVPKYDWERTKDDNGELYPPDMVLFQLSHHDIYISNICILGTDKKGVAFRCAHASADKDIILDSVQVYDVHKGIVFKGRGIKVMNSHFARLSTFFVGDWGDTKETNDNDDKAGGNVGQRGYVFQNNRLHSISYRFIRLSSGHASGLVFENNVIDHGRGLVFDVVDEAQEWVVNGNMMRGLILPRYNAGDTDTPAAFMFRGGAKSCVFTGNVFSSLDNLWDVEDEGPIPAHYMKFGSLTNCVIQGNSFDNCSADAIVIKGAINNSVVSGNAGMATGGEFEWDNPPMALNVEYRTTERHLGKPVYVKLIDLGNLENAGETKKSYVSHAANCVRFEVTAVDGNGHLRMLPFVTTSGAIRTTMRCTQYQVIVETFSDLSSYTAKAKIWYTKN